MALRKSAKLIVSPPGTAVVISVEISMGKMKIKMRILTPRSQRELVWLASC